MLRRSRGYVPRADRGRDARSPRPVLACGAQLKNTFCLGRRRRARGSARTSAISRTSRRFDVVRGRRSRGMEQFLDVTPEVDRARPASRLPVDALCAGSGRRASRSRVQHHHAHVASAMAEHGLDGPGDRHRLRRHRLRHRRHGVGRRDAGRRLRRRSSAAGDVPAAAARRRRRAPSASRGASRWRSLDDAFEGDAPLDALRAVRRRAARATSTSSGA